MLNMTEAIVWTKDDFLLVEPLGTNLNLKPNTQIFIDIVEMLLKCYLHNVSHGVQTLAS